MRQTPRFGKTGSYQIPAGDTIFRTGPTSSEFRIIESGSNDSRAYRSFLFSKRPKEFGPGSVVGIHNWRLSRDGIDVSNLIRVITNATVDPSVPSTLHAELGLLFHAPLAAGNYELVAKGDITDTNDVRLDGNADGDGGDDYVERFTITAPPLPLQSSIQVVGSSLRPTNAVIAVNPDDESYVVAWQGTGQNGVATHM